MSVKPRILLLCDRPGWAFDFDAHNISKQLGEFFDFEILFVVERPVFDESEFDLIWVFWWGERYHRKYVTSRHKVVKEISSHRWEVEESYGLHTPQEAYERYMMDAGHLVVFTKKLQSAFEEMTPNIHYYPKGINADFFKPTVERTGALKIGWAGNINDLTKGVSEILIPACGDDFLLKIAGGALTQDEMVIFYNDIDVICVASLAESGPLTLLEAMACGCFPISTNVGVAGELITNGKNGLLVDRSSSAFRSAFNWCRNNIDLVRSAGKENVALIRDCRTDSYSAEKFHVIADRILAINKKNRLGTKQVNNSQSKDYSAHFNRVNPGGDSTAVYESCCNYYKEEIEALLPFEKLSKILEIGTGHGHFLKYLIDRGYKRVFGIDVSEGLMAGVRRRLADQVESLEVAEAFEYLSRINKKFNCIVMLDMIEHVHEEHAVKILSEAWSALDEGGVIIIRTPNMANILGCYSLHMDLTHKRGYTELSLFQALEKSGFSEAKSFVPSHFVSKKRKIYNKINKLLHGFIYKINDRVRPTHYSKNIIVYSKRD